MFSKHSTWQYVPNPLEFSMVLVRNYMMTPQRFVQYLYQKEVLPHHVHVFQMFPIIDAAALRATLFYKKCEHR